MNVSEYRKKFALTMLRHTKNRKEWHFHEDEYKYTHTERKWKWKE